MPGRAIMSAVRWRHASTTSLGCAGSRSANEPVWSLEKQMTSHRPCPGRGTGPRRRRPAAANGSAARPRQARKAVLEDGDVVVGGGYLAGLAGRARAQRTCLGGRLVRAVLPQRGDDHPLSGLAVEPQLGLLIRPRWQRSPIGHRLRGVPGQREEQQIAAVGKRPPGWPHRLVHVTTGTSAIVSVPTCAAIAARSSMASPASVMSVCTCDSMANTFAPTSPSFV